MHCCFAKTHIDSELVQKYTSFFQYICCITRIYSTLVQHHKLFYFFTQYLYTYIYGALFLYEETFKRSWWTWTVAQERLDSVYETSALAAY